MDTGQIEVISLIKKYNLKQVNMKKFRIVKKAGNLNHPYRVQHRFLWFFWETVVDNRDILSYKTATFSSIEEAENYIEEIRELYNEPKIIKYL